jgi:pimeloyl-ACP methyl ester carboxylesterase
VDIVQNRAMKIRGLPFLSVAVVSISFSSLLWLSLRRQEPEAFCKRDLASVSLAGICRSAQNREIFLGQKIRFYQATEDRRMAFLHKPSVAKDVPTLVFIHGLGDEMSSMKKMAEMAAKDGFGVLLVDLNGHGETLSEYLRTHDNRLPNGIDYRENIDDIKGLIQKLKLKSVSLVGHSYGGAIALQLSRELPPAQVRSVHALAPYLQRIDRYLMDSLRQPTLAWLKATEKVRAARPEVQTIWEPLLQATWNMTKTFRYFQDLTSGMMGLQRLKDRLLDPALDKYMSENYRKYFLYQLGKAESNLSLEERKTLDLRVEAAIMVTKGIRGLDFLDSTESLNGFPASLQIIGGAQDKLVIPQQIKEFTYRLQQYKASYELNFVEGDSSGHLFPQQRPQDVYHLILELLTRPS